MVNLLLPTLSRKTFALFLSLVLLAGLVSVTPLQAEMISSQEMEANNNAEAQMTENLETIDKALEKKIIQNRLEDLGYTPEEIQNRLDRLSPQQAQELAEKIDSLETGGEIAGWTNRQLVGVLLIVLIIAVIV